jgi:hypothetical protein
VTTPATPAASDPAGQPAGAAPSPTTPAATPAEKPGSYLGDVSDSAKPKADAKPEGDNKPKADGEKPKVDAPALEIKVPDGAPIDKAALDEFKALAVKHGLTSEQASDIVAFEVQRQKAADEAHVKSWEQQGQAWKKEIDSDPEYGGEKLEQTLLDAKKPLKKYGGEAVANTLAELGIGYHPELIKFLARIGQSMKEDNTDVGPDAGGGAGKKTAKEIERDFYSRPS